ncbi:hypothetical protein PMZ80_010189 [Knufia obscura]|uniref:Mtf2-like C-terminal domain-containing protein n=1 Tax=Knufia obscura TaxID=1635080 RepID=A0ABR0RBQ7_9EURO|nr:hypothetical protein PMZ80_010189 [Knufia obscura]
MAGARVRSSRGILQESLCPFLYETVTIRRPASTRRFSTDPVSREEETLLRRVERETDSPYREYRSKKHDRDKGFNFFRLKSQEVQERRGLPKASTLTSEERRAFQNIRKTFGADTEALSSKKSSASTLGPTTKDNDPSSSPALATSPTDLYDTDVERILTLFAPSSTTFNESEDFDSDRSVESESPKPYAPNLIRAAAVTALTSINHKIDQTLSSNPLSPDHALWTLLNEDILPLITLLQNPISMNSSRFNKAPKTQTERRQSQFRYVQQLKVADILPALSPTDISNNTPTATPATILHNISPQTPLLPLITILYPAATLLLLRTLTAHTPASLYTLALLPAIKDLGPTSYLLAGNTHFYNTLLQNTWDVYSDFAAMDRLLAEMKRDGVGFDEGTLQVLEGIRGDYEADMQRADVGGEDTEMERGVGWWDMGGNREGYGKVSGYWRDMVGGEVERKMWGRGVEGEGVEEVD